MTPEEIMTSARSYIGTPWHHRGRVKGHGIDCCGLLICVLRESGLAIPEPPAYGMGDEWELLKSQVEQHCVSLPEDRSPQDGDIVLFRGRFMTNHCAFYSGGNIVHAYQSVGYVVEHEFDDRWKRMYFQGYYRVKELATWLH